jgi:hypothetical protein
MRRIVAVALLAIFGLLPLIAAALPADTESTLPACCRRHGAHHCAMSDDSARSRGGTELHSARCSAFPSFKAFQITRTAAAVGGLQRNSAAITYHPVAHSASEILYRISYNRAGQKRGPPSLS